METPKKILALFFFIIMLGEAETSLGTPHPELTTERPQWLLVDTPRADLSDSLTVTVNRMRAALDLTSLWYVGIALFALMMIVLVLRAARDSELRALRSEVNSLKGRLAEMGYARERAEKSLQEEVGIKRQLLLEKNSAIEEIEDSFRKIRALTVDLREKQELVKGHDGELKALRYEADSLKARLVETWSAKERADKLLEEELRKKKDLVLPPGSAMEEVEKYFNGRLQGLENQLSENQELLKSRDGELQKIRSEASALAGQLARTASAKEKAESLFQEELRKNQELLQKKDAAAREAQDSSRKIQVLESQVAAKQELLKRRDHELEALRAELNAAAAQAGEMGFAKERAETFLQAELTRNNELLQEKDDAIKQLRDGVTKLESQLSDNQELSKGRDGELHQLRSKLSALAGQLVEMSSAKEKAEAVLQEAIQAQGRIRERLVNAREQAENSLQAELRKNQELLREKDDAVKALQDSATKIHALEGRMSETQEFLNRRDGELQALTSELNAAKEQLAGMGSAREGAENSLQEELRKNQELLQEKDDAVKALQDRAAKIHALEDQLSEKQGRDGELQALTSELHTVKEQLALMAFDKERAESTLQDELWKNQELLQQKKNAIEEVQKSLTGKLHALQAELLEERELVKTRDGALQKVRSELNAVTRQLAGMASAKEKAESLLQAELNKRTELLQEKNAAVGELEESLNIKIQALENRLSEKQELLKTREGELETLKSELHGLTQRLADLEPAQERAEKLLAAELTKKDELLQEKDHAIKEVEKSLSGRLHALELQLTEKQGLLKSREVDLETLRSEVNSLTARLTGMASDKEHAETLLRAELIKKPELLEANHAAMKELEESVTRRAGALENQLNKSQEDLKSRDAELATLRSQMNSLTQRLAAVGSAKERAERSLQEIKKKKDPRTAKDSAGKEPEHAFNGRIRALETQLDQKQELLDRREKQIEVLAMELKEKKVLLARQEIADLQAIKRQNSWKRRLAKLGISGKSN